MADDDGIDLSTDERTTFYGRELLGDCGRYDRLAWVRDRIGADDVFMLQGGDLARLVFRDAVDCYINGQFIAAIALAFATAERSLNGRLVGIGEDKIRNTLPLLKEALKRGWIEQPVFAVLSTHQELRNDAMHFRECESSGQVRRIVALKVDSNFEEHARQVLEAAIAVLHNTSV